MVNSHINVWLSKYEVTALLSIKQKSPGTNMHPTTTAKQLPKSESFSKHILANVRAIIIIQ